MASGLLLGPLPLAYNKDIDASLRCQPVLHLSVHMFEG